MMKRSEITKRSAARSLFYRNPDEKHLFFNLALHCLLRFFQFTCARRKLQTFNCNFERIEFVRVNHYRKIAEARDNNQFFRITQRKGNRVGYRMCLAWCTMKSGLILSRTSWVAGGFVATVPRDWGKKFFTKQYSRNQRPQKFVSDCPPIAIYSFTPVFHH